MYLERVLGLTPQTPEASTVPKPIHPDGPGLWHHKHMQAPPYVQHVAQALMRRGKSESEAYHMAVGLMHSWSEGHDGHGHHVHSDVRAAAAANLAKWEELRAHAHASHLAKKAKGHARSKRDHDLVASAQDWDEIAGMLVGLASGPTYFYDASMLKGGSEASAPGAKRITGNQLRQAPSQTVAAGPPLPPGVTLPTPDELNALGRSIEQAGLPGSDLVRGAAAHARAAATKMQANQPVDALHMLRSAQAGIISAHREFNASLIPVANVFSAKLDPAEAASARAEMYEGLRTRDSFRSLASQCAQHIDRIRRHIFHGMYNRRAEARF
jgi:hypothetical protein